MSNPWGTDSLAFGKLYIIDEEFHTKATVQIPGKQSAGFMNSFKRKVVYRYFFSLELRTSRFLGWRIVSSKERNRVNMIGLLCVTNVRWPICILVLRFDKNRWSEAVIQILLKVSRYDVRVFTCYSLIKFFKTC